VVLGHYWGDGVADVALSGRISGHPVSYQTRFDFPALATENPEIERLWAYASIEDAMAGINDFGEEADLKQRIIDLGVEYALVTDYTAMVVMSDEAFNERGIERSNNKRLATEAAARQQRASRPAPSRRVDTASPCTRNPARASGRAVVRWMRGACCCSCRWCGWWCAAVMACRPVDVRRTSGKGPSWRLWVAVADLVAFPGGRWHLLASGGCAGCLGVRPSGDLPG
jgi:hypothetical protein